jgi:DNA-binding PadR family transcriptional regulator
MGLQEALAGLLSAGPAHGYQLYSMLEGELGPAWETRQSHLYLTLARMERDGLVTGRRIRQRALPDRQVFELTSKGRALASRWLTSGEPQSEMVVKLAITRSVRPELFVDLAAAISDEVAGRLKALRQISGSLKAGFQQQALALEIARRQAEIRWLSSLRDDADAILAQPRVQKQSRHEREGSERLA